MKEVRKHKEIDGQVCSIYFAPTRIKVETDNWVINKALMVGFIIGESRKDNNDWFNGKKRCLRFDNTSTGRIGLKGLSWAQEVVLNVINTGEPVLIDGSDERRSVVYARMIKRASAAMDLDVEVLDDGSILVVKN